MKVCNFCGKSDEKVKLMVTSCKADICCECILECVRILLEQLQKEYKEGIELEFEKEEKQDG